jgi:hypothetical protein
MILASGLFPRNFNLFYPSVRRPTITPTHHALNRLPPTLKHGFNTPVIKVAHPALDPTAACVFTCV